MAHRTAICRLQPFEDIKTQIPREELSPRTTAPQPIPTSRQSVPLPFPTFTPNTYVTMFTSGLPGLDIDGLTGFNNNNYCGNNLSFDGSFWENTAGPSQPYTGVEVQGDLSNYPAFPSPSSAPTTLYPARGLVGTRGKLCRASQWR